MNSIDAFLNDLYEADPVLREHEAVLIPLLQKLLAYDPAQKPDAAFVQSLRMQLKEHAYAMSQKKSFDWTKLLFALGGAAAMLIVFIVQKPSTPLKDDQPQDDAVLQRTVQVGEDAYGDVRTLVEGTTGPLKPRPKETHAGSPNRVEKAQAPEAAPALMMRTPTFGETEPAPDAVADGVAADSSQPVRTPIRALTFGIEKPWDVPKEVFVYKRLASSGGTLLTFSQSRYIGKTKEDVTAELQKIAAAMWLPGTGSVTIALGVPHVELQLEMRESHELYIPVLRFPVEHSTEEEKQYIPAEIVIPLVR